MQCSPKSSGRDQVSVRHQQPPVLATFCRSDRLPLQVLHNNLSILDRVTVDVAHQSLYTHMRLLDVLEQTALVHVPLAGQLLGRRELAAAQLHGHLEAVGEGVVKVLHATVQLVPVGAVRDAALKGVIAAVAAPHHRVIFGVHLGQPLEDCIVRGRALLAALVLFPANVAKVLQHCLGISK